MIEISHVTKEYGKHGVTVTALDEVSLVIESEETIAITGKSGSGKTTLLKLIGGMDTPTRGSILYKGENISDYKNAALMHYRNREVGFVFQDFKLISELRVEENIDMVRKIGRLKKNKEYFDSLVESLSIQDILHKYPHQLSGGQQQRVAIARALYNQPKMLLCDEPTGNLDKETGADVMNLLNKIQKQYHMTVIIVTHDPDIAKCCQRIITLSDGKVLR